MKRKSLKLNATLNLIKQCCSILFPFITFPYVSRILGNEGFGKYNFAFSIADYFIIFAALGIHSYAVREGAKIRDQKDSIKRFCREVFTINCCSLLVSCIALVGCLLYVPKLYDYRLLILTISINMVLSTFGTDWVNVIYEDFLYITIRYIVIQLIALIMIFLLVKSSTDLWEYACITTFASSSGNLFNIFYVRKYVHVGFAFNKSIIRHLKPVLILFASAIAVSIYVNSDITMLGFYRTDDVVGIYSVSSRIYNIIKRLLNAVIIVATPRLAYLSVNNKESLIGILKRALNSLMFLALPAVAGMILMSKHIVRFVGGVEYVDGWLPLSILSFALIFALASSLFNNCILLIYRKEKTVLISIIVSALANITLNFILLSKYGMYGAAVTTVIAEAINLYIQRREAKKIISDNLIDIRDFIKCCIGILAIIVICLWCLQTNTNYITQLFAAIIISGIVYLAINYLLKNEALHYLVKRNYGEKYHKT